jgi:hypothetical protein
MPSESFDQFRAIDAATVCSLQGDGGIDEDTLAAHLSASPGRSRKTPTWPCGTTASPRRTDRCRCSEH